VVSSVYDLCHPTLNVEMTDTIPTLVFLIALVSAVRSTWSPCGVSMLSTVTPLAERSRGNRYPMTAFWYALGGLLGGATLGAVMAGLAAVVGMIDLSPGAATAILTIAGLLAAASDARIGGWQVPGSRSQVNELWLNWYRSWVYGLGFGWQIGTGVVTYLMTAGVYLLILAGALTASPVVALAGGLAFGSIRGIAVLAGAGISSQARLNSFHRRFESLRHPVELVTITGLVLVATIAAIGSGDLRLVVAAAVLGATILWAGFKAAPMAGPRKRTDIPLVATTGQTSER
jgi:hypothetical protein